MLLGRATASGAPPAAAAEPMGAPHTVPDAAPSRMPRRNSRGSVFDWAASRKSSRADDVRRGSGFASEASAHRGSPKGPQPASPSRTTDGSSSVDEVDGFKFSLPDSSTVV